MSSNINPTILFLGVIQLLLLPDAGAIENVALQGKAEQKSVFVLKYNGQDYLASASRAIDNITHVPWLPEEGCASTGNSGDTDAWWQVDLRVIYVIDSISVLNRWGAHHRLRDFNIRVGNESEIAGQVFCAHKSSWIAPGASETFRCVHTLIGRWVSIQRTNDKGDGDQGGQGWLQLCEVQVYGYENRECGHRRYGPGCPHICHCANNQDCDKKTGNCPQGSCDGEYGGSTCSIALPVLYWRNANTATVRGNTVEVLFYQFKKGTRRDLDTGDGPVGQYTVEFQEGGSPEWVINETLKRDDNKDFLHTMITGLKYNTRYNTRVVPWYQQGDILLRGRAESAFLLKTHCGRPEKPRITNITGQEIPGGARVIVAFKLVKGGHNCDSYWKIDLVWRRLGSNHLFDKDFFFPADWKINASISMDIQLPHEFLLKVYNNGQMSKKSDPLTFPPITVAPVPSTTTTTTRRPPATSRNVDPATKSPVTNRFTSRSTIQYKPTTKTERAMKDNSESEIRKIVGSVVSIVGLIIIIIVVGLILFNRNKKQNAETGAQQSANVNVEESKHRVPAKSVNDPGIFNQNANLHDEVDAGKTANKRSETSIDVTPSDNNSTTANCAEANASYNINKDSYATSTANLISPISVPAISNAISSEAGPVAEGKTELEDELTPELTTNKIKTSDNHGSGKDIAYVNRDLKQYDLPLSKLLGIISDKKHKAAFKDEHKSIKESSRSYDEGSKPENLNKNKYRNIRAYDHSRVILKKLDGDPYSDYINANYIDGNMEAKAYIAAQGPKEDTVDDFWRMVWEVNANRIVMVTKVVENAKSKTMQYWPEAKGSEASVRFGDIYITLEDELGLADNVIHTLSVTHKGETRRVWHLHFTSWPDKGIPRQAASLLNFRKMVRTYDGKAVGPTIVHCSAGVGRTGTYIALDMLLEQVEEKDGVNIYKTVEKLREQRMNMVQTQGQYIFLHDALIEHLYSVDTSITTPLFKEEYRTRLKVNPETGKTKLQEEFSNLAELRVPPAQERCEGLMSENKKKNREKLIVPANTARPYLMTHVQGRNNYINAVFVDGLVERDMFLVTQHPLPDTVVDFWRMILDYKCQTIVMLNQTNEKEVPYWPVAGDTEMNIGPFNVEISKLDQSNPAYHIRTMVLKTSNGDKPLEIRQFQLLGWSNKEELPPSIPDLISLVNSVSAWHKKTRKGKVKKNIVVHCLNGNKKSGLFCVVYSVLDQIRFNQDVDVFRAVQVARENRYQFITSTEQYKFCFDVALEFLSQFDTYANFDDQTVKK